MTMAWVSMNRRTSAFIHYACFRCSLEHVPHEAFVIEKPDILYRIPHIPGRNDAHSRLVVLIVGGPRHASGLLGRLLRPYKVRTDT